MITDSRNMQLQTQLKTCTFNPSTVRECLVRPQAFQTALSSDLLLPTYVHLNEESQNAGFGGFLVLFSFLGHLKKWMASSSDHMHSAWSGAADPVGILAMSVRG